jgi:hypothetical protein
MAENQGLLNELKSLLKRKRSKQWYAEQLKITLSEVNELLKEMRGKNVDEGEQFLDSEPTHSKEFEQALRKVSNDKGTIESTITLDFEPKSDIELAELHKIDLEKYIITNYWSKVLPTGKFTSSIFSKRKGPEDYTADDFSKFLENYKSNYIPISSPKLDNDKSLVDIELSLSDYHLGKRYVDGDNDPETRATRFVHIAEALTHKVRSVYDINKVVFPISNDFFHTDNYQNTTTNGTPQDIIFKNDKNISFVREEGLIKATVVGSTFIGFHHGNCKIDALPLLFATHPVYSKWFGDATYREVHTGDKHHYMAKEIKGVRIQQMPSLSGTDRWHKDNNFVHSVRAALALVYDFKVGKVAEFEERI